MANEEHLDILTRGVYEWNRWRGKNRSVWPDLSGVSLSAANLNGSDLSLADLRRSHLISADLRGANLIYTNLSGAILSRANLSGAILGNTCITNVNLRGVEGLDVTRHHQPSSISTDTFERSHGQIPPAFLKGCGLTDWEILAAKLYNPDLTENERTLIHYEIMRIQGEQPIMQTRLFISYSHDDAPFVEALEPLLDAKGIRYWRDVHDMVAGRIETQIDRGIALHPLVLLVLSENSVKSDWVEDEATKAREFERHYRDVEEKPRDVLCPVALDDAWTRSDWPRWLRRQIEDYNILDFSGWQDSAVLAAQFEKLYKGIVLHYGP